MFLHLSRDVPLANSRNRCFRGSELLAVAVAVTLSLNSTAAPCIVRRRDFEAIPRKKLLLWTLADHP